MSEGLRERIARAIFVSDYAMEERDWADHERAFYLTEADAVIAELELRVRLGLIDGGPHPRVVSDWRAVE